MIDLPLRILTSVILAPLTLAVIYIGTPYITFLMFLTVFLILSEYKKISKKSYLDIQVLLMISGSFISILVTLNSFMFSLSLILFFFFLVSLINYRNNEPFLYNSFFFLYSVIPAIILLFIYDYVGFITILWMLCVIWASDIGGYIFGNLFGGMKLIPKVSPNKTWSGAIGSVFCSVLVSGILLYLTSNEWSLLSSFFAFLVSIIGQLGDIIQSGFKRYYKVKDTGTIFPGHGGVMDRVDSLWLASILLFFIVIFTNSGVETW